MPINKSYLHAALLKKLDEELAALLKAAESAYEGAVHSEAVSKSKYETHGLELSYLAGAQFERAAELQAQTRALRAQVPRDFTNDDAIALGALVVLEGSEEGLEHIYLCLAGGGTAITVGEKTVQVASPQSPLGQQLLESFVGDQLVIKTGSGVKTRLIVGLS